MINYKEFEVLYDNIVSIESAVFLHLRKNPLSNSISVYTANIRETLLKQFNQSFPCLMSEAERHPEFEYAQFFELLKKHPELLTESNKRSLIDLLEDIKINNVGELKGLSKIPTIEDFIK